MKRLSEEQLKNIGGEVFSEFFPEYSEDNEEAEILISAMITVVNRYMEKYQKKIHEGV